MRIAIVGGGYAGAATAWALSRRGHGAEVVLLEGELKPAAHASGLNAGLVGPLLDKDEAMASMSVRGAHLLSQHLGLTTCGSVRLVAGETEAAELAERAGRHGITVRVEPTSVVAKQLPLVAGAPTPVAVRCDADGKIDPVALAERYLAQAREAGVSVLTGARVTSIADTGGRVTRVETTRGGFDVEMLVDAAGAWAGQVALLAGLGDLGLVSYRRHLYVTGPIDVVDPSWPWVWDLAHDLYVRVDGKKLTLCVCDQEIHPPGPPAVSTAVEADLRAKLPLVFPALKTVTIEGSRACLRTFAPDRRFVVGPDPRLGGFFWVAGLGGSGATAGAAIGELAADLILGGDGERVVAGAARHFDPARLI